MRRLALLCLLAFVAACSGDDDDAAPSTSSSTTEATTTTTALRPPTLGEPVELDGVMVGVHPTKPIAYVSIVVPGEIGCEGGDAARLYAQPLTGGDAVEVVEGGLDSGVVLTGGADGAVAVVDSCEGFLSNLSVAQARADGTFDSVRVIDTSAIGENGQLQPGTIRWGRDGRSFVALVHDTEGEGSRVVRISLDGSVEELAHGDQLVAVEELANGRLAIATPTSLYVGHDAPVDVKVTSLALRPDRMGVAVVGEDGIKVAGAVRSISDAPASVASWSPDGMQVAYLRVDGDTASAWLSADPGDDVEVSKRAGFGAPLLTDDGEWVLYNEAVDSGQGFSEPHARARVIS